ncbi:uncharacterized protein I206_104813 [Kwoniella pini CBS 10737]|uniref:Uncharacterized protein n=1 Tax=Kwoniella pini CBS 10737 TaxID=1296096 RepID=A0A1B9I7Y0_9TREE|nr:uncharacterized protein I206_02352 [Kwoniella pini CBS 10737]OCF51637.1 hypothetical protein I206_02352 [Kwoniella pini CBS 10737]
MGCTSSKSIDPRYISGPIPIPSTSYNNHSYPPPHNHHDTYSQSNPTPQFNSPFESHLRPYQFPTYSFAPRDLPPDHPFANPYQNYMP